jgi:Na+-transporting methylmalonyl-CoA/oxaloacetate decarboxylase gamma subunit
MKRPYYLIYTISALMVASLFILESFGVELVGDGALLIVLSAVLILAVVFAIRRFTSWKNREPAEDEYTKKIMMKTSSYSFYVSLYLWLLISYFSEESALDTQRIIGLGIVGMAIVFAISWILIKYIGLHDE